MEKFWLKHKVAISLAAMAALFHVVFVVFPLVASGYSGEGLAMWLAIVDYPLMWVESTLSKNWGATGFGRITSILYYSFFGTLMYMLPGWVIGCVFDWLRRRSK